MSTNELNCNINREDYPVDLRTNIPYHLRDSSPHSSMPPPPPNGGLYAGPDQNKPWLPIKVTPTATNLINRNLLSANPPPGATEQYVGTNRLGNNYVAMPGVYWFNNTNEVNKGPFHLKVTKKP